jgi:hypothetical protein
MERSTGKPRTSGSWRRQEPERHRHGENLQLPPGPKGHRSAFRLCAEVSYPKWVVHDALHKLNLGMLAALQNISLEASGALNAGRSVGRGGVRSGVRSKPASVVARILAHLARGPAEVCQVELSLAARAAREGGKAFGRARCRQHRPLDPARPNMFSRGPRANSAKVQWYHRTACRPGG